MTRKAKRIILLAASLPVVMIGFLYIAYWYVEVEGNEEEVIPSHYVWRFLLATRLISPNDAPNGYPMIIHIIDTGRHPLESVQVFLDYGADINVQESGSTDTNHPGKWTALMTAVDWSYVKGVDFLLNHKADPNLERDDGSTALGMLNTHTLSPEGLRIAQLLIAAGADPCHRDHLGRPPWHQLKEGNPVRDFIESRCHAAGGG